MSYVRYPAVSGYFYSSSPESLKKEIEDCFLSKLGPGKIPEIDVSGERRITSIVSPHAGYIYSGPVAAHGYYSLALDGKPETFILIGPNHTGRGSGVSIMSHGEWETPLGRVKIDQEVSRDIIRKSEIIDEDPSAHLMEHSLEVQLPFLQYLFKDFKIVPIVMMMQDINTSMEVGKAVAESIKDVNAVIIASTDFTHYERGEVAERKDKEAIKAILELSESKLNQVVFELNVSMCGVGPVMAAISASKKLGAAKAELLKYATSGDITGDYSSVVGYASIKMFK